MGQALNIQLKESVIDVDGLYAEEIQLIKKLIGLLKNQKHNSYNRVAEEERENGLVGFGGKKFGGYLGQSDR